MDLGTQGLKDVGIQGQRDIRTLYKTYIHRDLRDIETQGDRDIVIYGYRDLRAKKYMDIGTQRDRDIVAYGLKNERTYGLRYIRTIVHRDMQKIQGFDRILDNNHYIQRDKQTWGDGNIGTYEHNDIGLQGYHNLQSYLAC